MHRDRISYLLDGYLENRLSRQEVDELNSYLRNEDVAGEVRNALGSLIIQSPEEAAYRTEDWDPLFDKIQAKTDKQDATAKKGRLLPVWRIGAAAAASFLLILTGWWWIQPAKTPARTAPAVAVDKQKMDTDVAPGSNKATLTLADNSTIDLDDAKSGMLGKQGNTQLIKQKDGQLTYQSTEHKSASTAHQYNVLTTPRGGQYQLILPDGSKVWLNAASSLRYPTAFSGNQRTVELRGEAYFEIAPNAAMPFRVNVPDSKGGDSLQIRVLGTHFNVNAYADEPFVNTTLLEGAVMVRKGERSALIKPGEQARENIQGGLTVGAADVEQAVAWKNGLFKFHEANIEEVMRQVSRWYDVEVVYVNGIPKDLFEGEIYRNGNVSKLLKILEASGVRFTIEGKKIFVKV